MSEAFNTDGETYQDKRLGNKWWKRRSKHGRDKIFQTPKIMLQAAYEYFDDNAKNPWYKKEVVKSGELAGSIIDVPAETPLSLRGLAMFWGVHTRYLEQFESDLSEEDRANPEGFYAVITHIKDIIQRQQIEGATLGVYNGNIISRLVGLVEKTDVTSKGKQIKSAGPALIVKMPEGVDLALPSNTDEADQEETENE
jgi:hypothetical protein